MSIQVVGWVLDHSTTRNSERLVLISIANHASDDGWAWPSTATIAREANVSPGSVKAALASLVANGHLSRKVNGAPDERIPLDKRPNLYRVLRNDQGESREVVDGSMTVKTDGLGGKVCPPAAENSAPPLGKFCPPAAPIGGPNSAPPPSDAVRQVFEAWLSSTGRSGRTVLDDKRRRLIAKALDRYPLADVLDAVRGWEHSAFHRGHNARGRPFNDLGLLLRDAQHIEQFRDAARGPREPDPGPGGRPRPAIDAVMKDRSKPSGRVIL